MRKVLRRINPSKSPGPDLIKGRVVKECTEELTSVLCQLFNRSLQENTIPTLWKRSEIRPIPKTNRPVELNDYRPVALTSVLVKCLERLVLPHILTQVSSNLDPLQFAYRPNRSVEDAVITVLNTTYSQLEKPKFYVRILFVDFSSAFNCMQPHILCTKLKDLQVDPYIILWIMDFLLEREQFVKVNNSASSILVTSTGAPQGTVISPVLFSLYTNNLRGSDSASMAVKFADDTALVNTSNSPAHFQEEATKLHQWCEEHYLQLNVKKTKELLISPQRRDDDDPILQLTLGGEMVERVGSYKYLGTTIDSGLTFNDNTQAIFTKCQQRTYLLRRLRYMDVATPILRSFYICHIESLLTFSFLAWYGSLSESNKAKLRRVTSVGSKLCGTQCSALQHLYEQRTVKKAGKIARDPTHNLRTCFRVLPSGRRYASSTMKKAKGINSFIPSAIRLLNKHKPPNA